MRFLFFAFLFFEDQHRTRRKLDQFGMMTLCCCFFLDQQRMRRKVGQPKNFGPLKNKFCPPKNNVLVAALHCSPKFSLPLKNSLPSDFKCILVGNCKLSFFQVNSRQLFESLSSITVLVKWQPCIRGKLSSLKSSFLNTARRRKFKFGENAF